MKKFLVFILGLVLMNSCQKETSFEAGGGPSQGLLQSNATSECFPKIVSGAYVKGTVLNGTTNFISVDVLVTEAGSYTISSDTANGVYFLVSGIFTSTGMVTVKVKGFGTPANAGVFNFNIRYDGHTCSVPVTFLPTGSGGPAVFTLAVTASTGDCTGAVVAGNYAVGVDLNSTNTATISVNVTTIGTYTISTIFQGMTFAATNTFANTGTQTVVLNGSGKPTTAGVNTIPITAGTSTCSFKVTVGNAAIGTLGGGPGACTPGTPAGTYTAGTPLTATNTVQTQVTITTPGVYTITTNTQNGVSFSSSGTLPNGAATVTLTGTGTPAAAGTFTFLVTFGTSTCTFPITFAAAPPLDYFPRTTNSNWSYEINDDAIDSLLRYVIGPTHSALGNTYNIFMLNDGTGPDSSGYFRKSGGDYLEFLDVGDFLGYNAPQWVEYTFLKDNVANGTNWKSAAYAGIVDVPPIPPFPLTVRLSYTIVGKDVSVSVTSSTGTVNYTNVIVVEEKFDQLVAPPSTWVDATNAVGYAKAYYARGIGLIKYEVFDEVGALTDQQELRRKQVF